jgi:hypothetical protein
VKVERTDGTPLNVLVYGYGEHKTLVIAEQVDGNWTPRLEVRFVDLPAFLQTIEGEAITNGLGSLATAQAELAALKDDHARLVKHHAVRGDLLAAWAAFDMKIDQYCAEHGIELEGETFQEAMINLLRQHGKEG